MITSTVTGNIGKAPELKTTASGKVMATFSVASTQKREGKEPQTTWIDVTCFDEQADVVAQRLEKGERVVVSGRMQLEKFTRKDGTEGQALRMLADEVGISMRFPKRERATSGEPEPW
jgi:single-strand DNA-binding protein